MHIWYAHAHANTHSLPGPAPVQTCIWRQIAVHSFLDGLFGVPATADASGDCNEWVFSSSTRQVEGRRALGNHTRLAAQRPRSVCMKPSDEHSERCDLILAAIRLLLTPQLLVVRPRQQEQPASVSTPRRSYRKHAQLLQAKTSGPNSLLSPAQSRC